MRPTCTVPLALAALLAGPDCVLPVSSPIQTQDGPVRADAGRPDSTRPCPPLASASAEPLTYGYSVAVSWPALPAGDALEIAWQDGERQGSLRVEGSPGSHVVMGLAPERTLRFRLTRRCSDGGVSTALELAPVKTGKALAFPIQTTVPYSGGETEVILFNCFQPLEGKQAASALGAITREGQVLWAWSSPDGNAVTDVDWSAERGSIITGVWGTFTELDLDGKVRVALPGFFHHDLDFSPLGFTALYYRFLFFGYVDYVPRLSEGIAVIDPTSGLVSWDWHLEEHIAPDDYNAQDIKGTWLGAGHDWTHANDLDYLPERKQFVINVRNLDRALFVDYPSGKVAGGMGSGTGLCEGLWSHSHEIVWLELAREGIKGRFLMFDNGNYRTPPWSRVIEVVVDDAAKACAVVWEYRETPDFFTDAMSSAYRLASGDTLITDGNNGRILQVDPQRQKRWEVKLGGCQIYQAKPVPRSFFEPGLVKD